MKIKSAWKTIQCGNIHICQTLQTFHTTRRWLLLFLTKKFVYLAISVCGSKEYEKACI